MWGSGEPSARPRIAAWAAGLQPSFLNVSSGYRVSWSWGRDSSADIERAASAHRVLRGNARRFKTTEAPVGIEPTNRGFADLCLTTWLRRRET